MESNAVQQPRDLSGVSPAWQLPLCSRNVFRSPGDPRVLKPLGYVAQLAQAAFKRVHSSRVSEVLLTWPRRLTGLPLLHSLTALDLLPHCDEQRLGTLFFPWNSNSRSAQWSLLVDRELIYRTTLGPLNRLQQRQSNPAYGYIVALHSLNHIDRDNARFAKALQVDAGIEHPRLYEIMPQHGYTATGVQKYDNEFLRRLRRRTWVKDRKSHIEAATQSSSTPFFLFGLSPDSVSRSAFANVGVGRHQGGRVPDMILIDLTFTARNALQEQWEELVQRLLDLSLELFDDDCPPVLAVTDDIYYFQRLRHGLVRDFEKWRSPDVRKARSAESSGILVSKQDPFGDQPQLEDSLPSIKIETYGSDIASFVAQGTQLRRDLLAGGSEFSAESVRMAIRVIQNLLALPGEPRDLFQFMAENYDPSERKRKAEQFDQHAVRSRLVTIRKDGLAGSSHDNFSNFAALFESLCNLVESGNPGRNRFDDRVRRLIQASQKSLLVFPSEIQGAFADWRFENDPTFAAFKQAIDEKIDVTNRKEIGGLLSQAYLGSAPSETLVIIEPRVDDLLQVFASPHLPSNVTVVASLATIDLALKRVRILLDIRGLETIRARLAALQKHLENAVASHSIAIPDLDETSGWVPPIELDLTGGSSAATGPLRLIRTTDRITVRAFDGTEFALYDADALHGHQFSRRLARQLIPGDLVCLFTPDFVSMAREKLHLTTNASDVLSLYHAAVAEAAQRLPGRDLTAKAQSLKDRILQANPGLDLPASIRPWIDVAEMENVPRNQVRPNAPRNRRNFEAFMRALGISDEVARWYWNLGIFWTRSMRIKNGAAFHQVFLGILIDPFGTASRLSAESREELWRVYDAAEEYVKTVLSNEGVSL